MKPDYDVELAAIDKDIGELRDTVLSDPIDCERVTKYVYRPTQSLESASRSALAHVLKTFFSGSAPDAVAAILDATGDDLTDDDLRRLEAIVEKAKKDGQ